MSDIVLTQQANPGAVGANLVALFVDTAGQPSFTGNDGAAKKLMDSNRPAVVNNIATTPGPITMNFPAGRIILSPGANSTLVINSFVTANTLVFAIPAANDSTGRVTAVESGNNNFTVYSVAPTANMPVNFLVIN